MGPAPIQDAKHWRDKAAEARLVAAELKDPRARAALLRIADDYDLMALRAQARAEAMATNPPAKSERL